MLVKKNPIISVIIPIFKVNPDFLVKAINSVLFQTIQDFEIVLIDNNAPLNCKKVIAQFQTEYPSVIRAFHEPEQGLCSARNKGIIESRGEFIALLDSDDIFKPNKLEFQLEIALKNPRASIIASTYSAIDKETENLIPNYTVGGETSRKIFEDQIKTLIKLTMPERDSDGFTFSFPSTMLFKKKTAQKIGLFDPRMNPQMAEDDLFLFKMFLEGDIIKTQTPLTLYRTGGGSDRSNFQNNPLLFLTQSNKAYFIMWETMESRGLSSFTPFKHLASFHLRTYGKSLIRFSDGLSVSRIFFFRAWKNNPLDKELLFLLLKSLFPRPFIPKLFWFNDYFSKSIMEERCWVLINKAFTIPPQWIE